MTHTGPHKTGKITASRGVSACALIGAAMLVCAPGVGRAQASDPTTMTPAATMIDNVASMSVQTGDKIATLESNRVSLQVQEILDVRVDVLTPEVNVEADSHNQRLGFRIRNLGNGWQAFDLSVSILDGDFDPHSCTIWVDWDGDGQLDTTRDRESTVTPVLAPGASVVAWVSCSIPTNLAHGALGRLMLRAYPAVLRNGATLGTMATAGNGGVFVVLGRSLRPRVLTGGGTGGGTDGTDGGTSPPATFRVGKVSAQLIKTQTVADAAGGARAMPGAIVTYSLEARFGAGVAVRQAVVSDAIPAGSAYVAGSLTLDGAPLSDAADGDAGRYAGGAIEVGLGDVAVPVVRTVTFKVRINPLGSAS
jgi:uncharacterized repeat protein (TIGR01451 family)